MSGKLCFLIVMICCASNLAPVRPDIHDIHSEGSSARMTTLGLLLPQASKPEECVGSTKNPGFPMKTRSFGNEPCNTLRRCIVYSRIQCKYDPIKLQKSRLATAFSNWTMRNLPRLLESQQKAVKSQRIRRASDP